MIYNKLIVLDLDTKNTDGKLFPFAVMHNAINNPSLQKAINSQTLKVYVFNNTTKKEVCVGFVNKLYCDQKHVYADLTIDDNFSSNIRLDTCKLCGCAVFTDDSKVVKMYVVTSVSVELKEELPKAAVKQTKTTRKPRVKQTEAQSIENI